MFKKKPTICVGAMSGTSLDGVDGAQITTDGEHIFEFGPKLYTAYSKQEKSVLHGALGKWAGDDGLEAARAIIHSRHIEVLSQFPQAEIFGFHGQTLSLWTRGLSVSGYDGCQLAGQALLLRQPVFLCAGNKLTACHPAYAFIRIFENSRINL